MSTIISSLISAFALLFMLPGGAPRLMIFGDSIAAQLAAGRDVANAGVPSERLSSAFVEAGYSSGEGRIVESLARHAPDVVLVVEGTNDIFDAIRLRNAEWADATERALVSVIRHTKGAGARVIVATVPPQRAGGQRQRDQYAVMVPVLNDRIKAVAKRTAVPVLDVNAIVSSNLGAYLSGDDVHLTQAGNEAVWAELQKLMKGME